MKVLSFIILAFIINVFFICSGSAQPASHVSVADNQFAFELYSRLASDKGNLFFSPYSLSSALGMTYEGARGQTAQQIRDVLHMDADDALRRSEVSISMQKINATGKAYEFSVANALWAQQTYPFKQDYLSLIRNTYFAEARNLDFVSDPGSSRVTINDWVSTKTKDRINDLLPAGSITSGTRLILTDAVYFKGQWRLPFKKENTKTDIFWLDTSRSVQTSMMNLEGESFHYAENDQAQLLKLFYRGNEISMLIILPRSKDLQDLEKVLTLDMLKQWQSGVYWQAVNVSLPKYKFDSSYKMKDVLIAMGMKLAFDQNGANFSGMANLKPDEHLYIDDVFHKAWIDTNEQGTEAAAATGVTMAVAGSIMVATQPKIFRADHPFIFVIQDDQTGHILFMGRVSDPREK